MIKLSTEDVFKLGFLCGQIETIKWDETNIIPDQAEKWITHTFIPESFNNCDEIWEILCKEYNIELKYQDLTDFEIDFLGRIGKGLYGLRIELNEKEIIDNSKFNFCTFKVGSLLKFMKDNKIEIDNIHSNCMDDEYFKLYNGFKIFLELNKNTAHMLNNHI